MKHIFFVIIINYGKICFSELITPFSGWVVDINKSYLKSFSPESLNFAKQQIDADVLHQLGYSIL